jgi:predicted transcriptional regulator
MKHLAIFKGDGANLILSGKKGIESRFSKRKNAPFGVISKGDLVYMKPSGKDIIGQFRVQKVIFFNGLEEKDMEDIKLKYGKEIAADETYWKRKENSLYGSLIFVGESSRFLTSPIKLTKKDLRGWVVLG